MTSRALLLLCVCMFLDLNRCFAVPAPMHSPDPADFEKRVICALEQNDDTAIRQLEKDIAQLNGPARADLRFRIANKEVEFEFRGVYPLGPVQPDSIEYLVSLDPHQNHETLLAVKEPEMARLRQFSNVFHKERGDTKSRLLDSRFCWMDGRTQRSTRLEEIFEPEMPKVRVDFINQLEIMQSGLGGNLNALCQGALLPTEPTEARVILVVPRGR